jgi:endonuclease/exonuclease/phosphatase family metal-dependent hydrolase
VEEQQIKLLGNAARLGLVLLATSLGACTMEVASEPEEAVVSDTQSALSSSDVVVMSVNVRIDVATDDRDIGRFYRRIPRLVKMIEHHSPDIIGMQEVETGTWDSLESELDDYTWYRVDRGDGEGVAILAKKSRFEKVETNYKNFKGSDRREANGCDTPVVQKRGNRVAARMKLEDKVTGEIIDVFNTHFPSADGSDIVACEKVGMAILLREYVHAFGDNVLLMGDFNTGVSESGTWSDGLKALTKRAYLTETFIESHDLVNNDSPPPYRTTLGDGTYRAAARYGTKIDHIFVAPAFQIVGEASIDYSLFDGTTRKDCRILSVESSTGVYRCGGVSLANLDVYSDHWAILSVVNRLPCAREGCAASID